MPIIRLDNPLTTLTSQFVALEKVKNLINLLLIYYSCPHRLIMSSETDDPNDDIPEGQVVANIYGSALLWQCSYECENGDLDHASHLNYLAKKYFPSNCEINSLSETNVNDEPQYIKKHIHDSFQLFAQYLIENNHLFNGSINWIEKANHLKLESLSLLE